MSLALEPANKSGLDKFSKALQRFMREDPTFRVGFDNETKQTIIRHVSSASTRTHAPKPPLLHIYYFKVPKTKAPGPS